MGRPSASKGPQGWPQGSKKKSKKLEIEHFGTDLGCFGGDFGTVLEYFRHDFGKNKFREFGVEKLTFK